MAAVFEKYNESLEDRPRFLLAVKQLVFAKSKKETLQSLCTQLVEVLCQKSITKEEAEDFLRPGLEYLILHGSAKTLSIIIENLGRIQEKLNLGEFYGTIEKGLEIMREWIWRDHYIVLMAFKKTIEIYVFLGLMLIFTVRKSNRS